MSNLYYHCSECLKPCKDVQRDFGIGAYEYWGASGSDSNWQWVSACCDGDLLNPEQYDEVIGEMEKDA